MTEQTRARAFLRVPPADLSTYPRREIPQDTTLYRSHHAHFGPGWFSSAPEDPTAGGRFDLPAPNGTCYTATDPMVALRERLGPEVIDVGEVSDTVVDETRVSRLRLRQTVVAADTSAPTAANFHTLELVTSEDYATTQQWARRFHSASLGGVFYQARFTTRDQAGALALFDTAGPDEDWKAEGEEDVRAMVESAGITVSTRPPSRASFAKAVPPAG